MKIGKTIKTVTSPKRKIQKAKKFEPAIPVQIPTKVPETVSSWKVNAHMLGWDVGTKDRTVILTSVA